MPATIEDILDSIGNMTVLELVELKKAFEEKFDVTAAAPVAVAVVAGPGGGGAAAEEAEEQSEFDVILTGAGAQKIQVIKEAKDVVDAAPKPILEKVSKEEAEKAKAALEGAGATVEVK